MLVASLSVLRSNQLFGYTFAFSFCLIIQYKNVSTSIPLANVARLAINGLEDVGFLLFTPALPVRYLRLLHDAVDVLALVLVPDKLLDLGVVHRPVRWTRWFGWFSWRLVLLVLLAQQLSDRGHVLSDCPLVSRGKIKIKMAYERSSNYATIPLSRSVSLGSSLVPAGGPLTLSAALSSWSLYGVLMLSPVVASLLAWVDIAREFSQMGGSNKK